MPKRTRDEAANSEDDEVAPCADVRQETYLGKEMEDSKSRVAVKEQASDRKRASSMQTGWTPPTHIRTMRQSKHEAIRNKWRIVVDGDDVPPPIEKFKHMRFPAVIRDHLAAKGIERPTPLQIQGLPIVLSGVDLLGNAPQQCWEGSAVCAPDGAAGPGAGAKEAAGSL